MSIQSTAERVIPATACITGYGQRDTHAKTLSDGRPNLSKSAGMPYDTITGEDIAAMVENPPSVEKSRAQWFIPSTYTGPDCGASRP